MSVDDVAPTPVTFDEDELEDVLETERDVQEAAPRRDEIEDVPDRVIRPQIHELGAGLTFADESDGMAPYWAIVSQFDECFYNLDTFEAAGDEWRLNHDDEILEGDLGSPWNAYEGAPGTDEGASVCYWQGRIAAREEDSADAYYEYNVPVVATGDDVGEKKVNFQFRPALPNATLAEETDDGEFVDTGEPIQSLPDDLPEGIRVQVDAANVEPEDVLEILRGLAELLDINPSYFADEKLHEWSRIYQLAMYVRIDRDVSEDRIVNEGGLLDRLAMFASNRSGQGHYKWDNEEIIGHYQAVAANPTSHEEFYGDHSLGKFTKAYHMATPEDRENSVTYHPKLEIQYSPNYSGDLDRIPWRADHADPGEPYLEVAIEELEEWLANVLEWAGLPLVPDPDVYVPDEYFSLEAVDEESDERIREAVVSDPTERLVEEHRELATSRVLEDPPTDGERDVLRTIADGGSGDVDGLAERAGRSESTVYRTLGKFDDLLELVDGRVGSRDSVVHDRLRELFATIEREIDDARRSIQRLARRGEEIDEEDPFTKWAERYDVDVREHGRELEIRLGNTRELSEYQLAQVIREGARLARAIGVRTFLAFARASINAAGYRGKRALICWSGTTWKTAVGGYPVDVDDGYSDEEVQEALREAGYIDVSPG